MSQDKTHNGWTNFETWCVYTWLVDSQGSYLYWKQAAQWAKESGGNEGIKTGKLAHRVKEELEEQVPEVTGMWADLLGAALSEVNWFELAKALLALE